GQFSARGCSRRGGVAPAGRGRYRVVKPFRRSPRRCGARLRRNGSDAGEIPHETHVDLFFAAVREQAVLDDQVVQPLHGLALVLGPLLLVLQQLPRGQHVVAAVASRMAQLFVERPAAWPRPPGTPARNGPPRCPSAARFRLRTWAAGWLCPCRSTASRG